MEQAIAALEAQRPLLGDAVAELLLAPARAKLAALKSQAHLPDSQRKVVTVLFADISGFTALSEKLDAEDVHDTMNALWQRLDTIITEHGGKIDKHIGDGVVALWGVALAREDDPERAIRAALAMQAEATTFSASQTQHLPMRIGINTGPVLFGLIGSTQEWTALGDTVNVASRLENAAPLGGVLIAYDTYRHVRGVFDVTPQPPLNVKGKSEPLQTYLVRAVKPRAFRMSPRGVEGIETRLVGRAAEMTLLQEAFQQVTEEHVTRVVTIVAEAGLGKSRLQREFLLWADLSDVAFRLLRGRAAPSASDAPYALLRDVLAYRFQIQESDPLETVRAKLETGMAALCPGDPRIQEKAHFIGHLAGWDFSASPYLRGVLGDTSQIRALALHFLTRFFENVAAERPVLLLLEDIHWADRGSLDALRHVLGNLSPGTPLLAIANARPTLFERFPAWQITAQTRINLRPLSENDSATLVGDILRRVTDLPPNFCALIVRQAEGNPFYLEELIKMLIDESVIQPGETEWHVRTEHLASLRVPPTLTGILQARLDSLPPAERLALQRAAVIGRIFWDTAVQALGESSADLAEVQAQFDSAQRRELVFQRKAAVFAATREYVFKHALLRDVAYETVLKRERPAYHARAAAWLEKASGTRLNEYLPQLAEHYEKAGQSAQAAQYFERAGDAAWQVSAFNEAARFYARVQPPNAPTTLKLAEAHFRLSEYPAVRQALEQAQDLAETEVDRGVMLVLQGELARALGDYAGAQNLLTEALPRARLIHDRATLARVLAALGSNAIAQGKLPEAQAIFDESLTLARQLGDLLRELSALNRLGVIANRQGKVDEAERLWQDVYQRAEAAGNRELAMSACNNLGVLATRKRDYLVAQDNYQQALALAREIGSQHGIVVFLNNLADGHIRLGELAAARAELSEALNLALRLGAQPWMIIAVTALGYLAHAEGQTERALALIGMARCQPAWSEENQRELEFHVSEWGLAPAVLEAGYAKGAAFDWETTLQELVNLLETPKQP